MSSFNAFLGGVKAGQAAQQRQSAFNEEMAYDPAQAMPAFGAGPKRDVGTQTQRPQVSRNVFKGLDMAQREEVQADLTRKSQIVAALSALPVDQQSIGIQTYGKDFGIDPATLQQAAADPSTALATFSSSLQEAEMMLEQSRPGLLLRKDQGYGNLLDSNQIKTDSIETPAALLMQENEGQDVGVEPYSKTILKTKTPVSPLKSKGVSGDTTFSQSKASNGLGWQDQSQEFEWMSEEYVEQAIRKAEEWYGDNIPEMTEAELALILKETAEYYQEFGANTMALGALASSRSGAVGGAISAYGAFWFGVGKLLDDKGVG